MIKHALFLLVVFAVARVRAAVPDMPPDATSTELRQELMRRGAVLQEDDTTPIGQAEKIGLRNLQWLNYINDHRSDKLSFTSKATENGYPIEKPVEYSPDLIAAKLESLIGSLPAPMKAVLLEGAPFTVNPPIATDEYLEWGRKTDTIYQTALRWVMMQPYLSYLERARAKDIRGIYFFDKMSQADRMAALEHPSRWKAGDAFGDWMISMCMNNGASFDTCKTQIAQAVAADQDLNGKYDQWKAEAQGTYDEFFEIYEPGARRDIDFHDANALHLPFLDPGNAGQLAFLRDNIQDEWRFQSWHLLLDFGPEAAAHARWVPGATPHVNALGGDEITMNADQPLTEYDAQWTIRHEFGHVLGFRDCYVEYYDRDRSVIVSYQLDIDDLMCSRHGHIQQRHVNELKRVYFHAPAL